jgi:hypothetical protein
MPAEIPQLKWQAFRLWKRGCASGEYEDAAAGDPASGRFAVADGTSEASFAAQWARGLAEGFVAAAGSPWQGLEWLAPLRRRWADEVDRLELPWYAEAKREEGAFATLLGLVIRPPEEGKPGTWRALAVGDSCLFRTRAGRLLRSFPLEHSSEFGNQPRLLGSRSSRPDLFDLDRDQARGRWRPGDRFLLMTDALAQWFLHRTEEGEQPQADIERLLAEAAPQEAFAAWVEERRDHQGLRNDDVTLVVVDVADEPAPAARDEGEQAP